MKNLWSDKDARAAVRRYAAQGYNNDWALRAYSTRLLGGEPKLVQHGGGNTSVKTIIKDKAGALIKVLCVKGSGWDMATIEPSGLPAVKLAPLLKLASINSLSDEDMVASCRGNLVDPNAPTPSVETLLHAFISHKFIDHTHANAVLALIDRPNGLELAQKVYGKRVGLVSYVMPGFDLAIACKRVIEAQPNIEGLILNKHGIFSFGSTAREAYDRMINLVNCAERYLVRESGSLPAGKLPKRVAEREDVAPILRGLIAMPHDQNEGTKTRFVLDHRKSRDILNYVNGCDLRWYARRGPVTPDHVIRTKPMPLILAAPEAGRLEDFAKDARKAVDKYVADYKRYFERFNAKSELKRNPLDPMPRVILIPGIGVFGVGTTAKDAAIAADIAETCISVTGAAERGGGFETISARDQFEMEYWSLEQAKLAGRKDKTLQGQIAVITGGAGTIGFAVAKAFREKGSEIALVDFNEDKAKISAKKLGGIGIGCDVTNKTALDAAFRDVVGHFGGVDILVSNAGASWEGAIADVADLVLRQSFELNFFAHQYAAQAAVHIMKRQGTGGALLFNISKQVINPGPNFGPYGLPKAATMALMRQYAVEYGSEGIASNAVHADRIRSGLLTSDFIKRRAKVRGVSEREYMAGNLLGREVHAEDVAEAFVALVLARKTTGAVLTVDGGNIAAALR